MAAVGATLVAGAQDLTSARSMAIGDKASMSDVSRHHEAAPLIRRQVAPAETQAVAVEESSLGDDKKDNIQETSTDAQALFQNKAMTKLGGGHIAWKVKDGKCVTRHFGTQKLTVAECGNWYDQLWYWDEHWRLHNEEDGQGKCVQVHDVDSKQVLQMQDCDETRTTRQQFIFGRRRDNHKVSLISGLSADGDDKCWQSDESAGEIKLEGCDKEQSDQKFHFTDRRRSFHRRRRAGWDQQGDDALDEQEAGTTHASIKHDADKDEEHTEDAGSTEFDDIEEHRHGAKGKTNQDLDVPDLPESS